MGERNIDTLTLHANELDGKYLAFKAHMGNRRGTWDDMAQVSVEGGIKGSTVDFMLRQQNIKHEAGYRLGCNATLTDTAVNARLFPSDPIIGYRQWTINDDNFVNYDLQSRMLDANLNLRSGDSGLKLVTNRQPGAATEDIKVDIVLREQKPEYCRNKRCILIDDFGENIDAWEKCGGTGIKFRSAEETRKILEGMGI